MNSKRKAFAGVLALVAAAMASVVARSQPAPPATPSASQPPTYAVLSLIGDEFNVVERRDQTSSRTDNNQRRSFPVTDAVFDGVALEAAERAIQQKRPAGAVLRFSIRDPRLFKLQERVLADAPDAREVREALLKLFADHQVSHLVLITKRRDEASFGLKDGTTGLGKIAGLGFYVDPLTQLMDDNTGEYSNGYFAAYAYMDVALIDVASRRPLRSVPVRESQMVLDKAKSRTFRAWDAMTGQQKVDGLERLIRKGVEAAVARALAD